MHSVASGAVMKSSALSIFQPSNSLQIDKRIRDQDYPTVLKMPVLTMNVSQNVFLLCRQDMHQLHEKTGLHMVKEQQKIEHLWPLLAMWGLENMYIRCKALKQPLCMDTDSKLKFRLALLIKSVKKLAALNLISEDLSEEFPEEFEKDEWLLIKRYWNFKKGLLEQN